MRLIYFVQFTLIALLLFTSLYLQIFGGFVPCTLCTLQRLTFALLGILFFIGIWLNKRLQHVMLTLCAILASLAGMSLAGRQIWLQHQPSGGECGVNLQSLLQDLPANAFMQQALVGTTNCAERTWEFLRLDMAEWSFIWFSFFFIISFYLFLKARNY